MAIPISSAEALVTKAKSHPIRVRLAKAAMIAVLSSAATVIAPNQSLGSGYQTDAIVVGSTVYDPGHLLAFAYHHIRTSEGQVTPSRLAAAIELIYREDGYLLAEVQVIPSADGRKVHLRVSEGKLEHVSIEGVDARMHTRIRETIEPLLHARPLTRKAFERAIMLVDDIAGLHVITEIDYPRTGGGARLRIIANATRSSGSLMIDAPPRQLGRAVSAHVEQSLYSVISTGDVLRLYAGGTLHFKDQDSGHELYGLATYRKRLTSDGTFLEGVAGNVRAMRDASGKLVSTDLDGQIFGAAVGHPFWRDFHHYGYGLLEFRNSAAESRGGGFAFESQANVGAAALLYGHVFSGGGTLEVGLTVSGGHRDGTVPAGTDDGDDAFWHVRSGGGFVVPLVAVGQHLALRGEVVAQMSAARLPAVEELQLGDRNLLRGYALAEVHGDSGLAGKLELSRHIDVNSERLHSLRPFAFLDFGYVRNHSPSPFEVSSKSIASVGAGVDATLTGQFSVRGWVGLPLADGTITRQNSTAGYLAVTKSW